MNIKEGDLVECTINCGPSERGKQYVVKRSKLPGGKLCIAENEDATEHCSCIHKWELIKENQSNNYLIY